MTRSAAHYFDLARDRGIRPEWNPDLSTFDPARVDKVKKQLEVLRHHRGIDDRVHPTYQINQHNRIISVSPNIQQLPYALLKQGHFRDVGVAAFYPYVFVKTVGEEDLALDILQARKPIGDILVAALGLDPADKDKRQNLKLAFFSLLHDTNHATAEQQQQICKSFPKLRKDAIPRAKVVQEVARLSHALPLRLAEEAEKNPGAHRLVGFHFDEILVETDDAGVEHLTEKAYEHLADLTGVKAAAPPTPAPIEDPLLDCLQWLKDCGGVMACSNNPMAHQLIKAGYAKKGGYDSLGRRTLVLVEEGEAS